MNKLSKRHQMRKLSKRDNADDLIKQMREIAKKDSGIIAKFEEYSIPLDHINDVPIEYADLEVSAKTKDGHIYLNEKLLEKDDPLEASVHYIIHELVHVLQQRSDQGGVENKNDDYLDKDTEIESFQTQIDFKEREEGKGSGEEYADGLLDHHGLSGKERKDKKKELMSE